MQAIIFDMDGVLVDSMHYHAEAWDVALKTVGISIDKKIIYELEGANYRQVIDIILRQFGRIPTEEDVQDIGSKKLTIFGQIARVKPFDGIRELLETLKPKYKLAVVSGSNRSTVHETLNTFFPDTFHVVVDGEETKICKPSPEPYLKAVERLGVSKDRCLVIENAPLGIRSAKSAGLRCIAVTSYLGQECLKEADLILDNHREIGLYIQNAEKTTIDI
ncbi:MAG: HAD family phosphatase [Candidatus Brocadiaceae bacterium]|uniref:HAD family hydrolase n=1 Tax=Candidatus Wunengus sp. YC61 TaxID=3367698 RepID=UPI0027227A4F|nr:HAD family phosphatase [Candidatus Brocadiaceae bacterium]